MSNISIEFEIKKGYYTRDELRNCIENNIFFEVKHYTSNGQVKDATNEINFLDIVKEIQIDSITSKE